MNKNLCDICNSSFSTKEGLSQHKKRGFYNFDFNGLILKNKHKYFIFLKNKKITRKHDLTYNISYFYLHSFVGNVIGNVIKNSKTIMTSTVMDREIKNNNLKSLKLTELKSITNFLNKRNIDKSYFSTKIQRYSTLL